MITKEKKEKEQKQDLGTVSEMIGKDAKGKESTNKNGAGKEKDGTSKAHEKEKAGKGEKGKDGKTKEESKKSDKRIEAPEGDAPYIQMMMEVMKLQRRRVKYQAR